MSLPKYSDYKGSGVDWIGDIPAHWDVSQSRRMFKPRSEPALPDDQMLTASQKYGVLPQTEYMLREGRRVVEVIQGIESLKHVEPDDFIISMRSFQGGIEWCRLRGSTSFHYVMLTPIKWVWPAFFAYLLKSSPYIQALRRTTDLVRDGQELRFSNFAQVPLPVVPLEEQKAIAAFLDREVKKIDDLTAEQEKLIALLAEKRQAALSRAVTRGLNPNAPMKPSGVAWLGDVPRHWQVKQLKHVAKPGTAITYGIVQAGPHHEGGVPYIKTSDMSGDRLPLDGYALTSPDIDASYSRSRVSAGDIVIAIRATVGKCLPVPSELTGANLTQGTAKVSPGDEVATGFLLGSLRSTATQTYFDSMAKGATFKEITLDALRRTPVLVPPKEEQLEIAAFVDAETSKLDTLEGLAARAVDLLGERRTALIAAAVTGQIDVRDVGDA